MKKNCWEVKACGLCLKSAGDTVSCPVCKENRLHGVHGGVNAGRACWTIPHTLCGGNQQGAFGRKFKQCQDCEFYQMVRSEEKGSFQLSATILSRLN